MCDYSELLIRIREETRIAHRAFLNHKPVQAETAAIELLRLSCKLLDASEESIAARIKTGT